MSPEQIDRTKIGKASDLQPTTALRLWAKKLTNFGLLTRKVIA